MRATPLAIGAALSAAFAANAAFAGITIDGTLRIVYMDDIGTNPYKEGPDTGTYVDTVSGTSGAGNSSIHGEATQNTNIQPLKFSGSGSARLNAKLPAVGGPHNESIFRVTFTITTPYAWVTKGTVSQTTHGGTGQAIARLTHDDSGSDVLLANADVNLGTTNVDFSGSGILMPGTYYFATLAWTDQGRGGDDPPHTADVLASFNNVSLTLSAVPEPASLSLLALGAGGLMLRRRAR